MSSSSSSSLPPLHLPLSLLKTSYGHPMVSTLFPSSFWLVSELEVEMVVLKAYDGEESGVWRQWVEVGTGER
ncbi:hypothetical protein Tco_0513814 [Tanacetum coccineum]